MIFRDGPRGFVMNDTAQFVSNLNVARFVDRLRVEHDAATRASLHKLLLEELNNLGFNLKQLGCVQREVIEGSARIAIQMAVVETLTADGQDVRLAKSELSKLIEIQSMVEQYRRAIVDAIY
jgi:uncharacterized protein (UPF0335 family)